MTCNKGLKFVKVETKIICKCKLKYEFAKNKLSHKLNMKI